MSLDDLFSRDFRTLEFPADTNMVYVIGIKDERKGFFPFYVGRTARLMGRMGDYDDCPFDLSSLPDFHVGRAIKFFRAKGKRIEVKYILSNDAGDDEEEWKAKIQRALGTEFRLMDEPMFKPTSPMSEEQQKVERYCIDFLDVLEHK